MVAFRQNVSFSDAYFVDSVQVIDELAEQRKKKVLEMVKWNDQFKVNISKLNISKFLSIHCVSGFRRNQEVRGVTYWSSRSWCWLTCI